MNQAKQSILVISSHVIRGSVGSRVSVNVLEQMGYPVWSMFTVSMTWQPRHGASHRLVVSEADFQAWADDILRSPWCGEINAIMTGYFVADYQIKITANLIKALKQKNPHLIYFCDPVMADEAGLYVPKDIATSIVDHLIPLADIIKPNRSELEWISGKALKTNDEIIIAAKQLGAKTTVVTSAWPLLKNSTGNLLINENDILLAEHRLVENPVNGLGDMTAALFLARRMAGKNDEEALHFATTSVYALLRTTIENGGYELLLENNQHILTNPTNHITLRHLNAGTQKRSVKVKSL